MRELKAVGGDLRALRLALTGAEKGPELAAVLAALPREEALARADRARRAPPDYDRAMRLLRHVTRGASSTARPPPGPIRMYSCGSTVYQRVHVGNSRPFVVAMWLRSWLRETGYEMKLVHNITDINDKVYDAAPGDERASSPRARRAGTSRTRIDLGLGRPDVEPTATETIPADRRLSRS